LMISIGPKTLFIYKITIFLNEWNFSHPRYCYTQEWSNLVLNYLAYMGLLSKSVIWNPIVSGVIFCNRDWKKISSTPLPWHLLHRFFLYIIGFDLDLITIVITNLWSAQINYINSW
jgi:hypothetical protein